ncbi:hypothetical protein [Hymenobacter sp. BT491]|uniref:hypothetical protein n=1 Tax=Hymenobacter sp. BT491 TaxID=2766779 RepID=UPI00165395FF|nr:hypothetical protein [Hymenobacter sp. BT491]MBC6989387.1 hypothetical protein [Hymenobacter sp. BT491]
MVRPDIRIDAITLGLLILSVVPWLAPIIKSIEVPGVGKLEFQELKDKVEQVQGVAQSADRKSDFAIAEPSVPKAARSPKLQDMPSATSKLLELAKEYNNLRERLPSGNERTIAMTSIVRQMTNLAPELHDYDVPNALNNEDRGIRLTAYAYLFARPEFSQLANLINSLILVEDKPFGQYWAIQALGKLIANRLDHSIDNTLVNRLKSFQASLQVGTDRYYELGKILKDLDSKIQ